MRYSISNPFTAEARRRKGNAEKCFGVFVRQPISDGHQIAPKVSDRRRMFNKNPLSFFLRYLCASAPMRLALGLNKR